MSTILVDFITHNETRIAAPPNAIWPFMVDTNAWHPAQTLTRVGGPVGEVGERCSAAPHQTPETITLLLATRGAQTLVSYHVYCRQTVPSEYANVDLLAHGRQHMELGLKNLKNLVETGRASP